MRIALGQLDMVWENADASIDRAETLIKQAAEAAAECIIFPEMSFTGVTLNTVKVAEDPKDSRTVQRMKELAKSYNLAIGFGWAASPEGEEKLVTNRFTLLDKGGTVVGEYKKMHPFTYGGESDCYAKGNEIVTVPFLGRKVALFICYDLRFPEIFQIAAREADALLVIANWPQIRREHWQTLLRARAIETQSYVVGVNCVGMHDGCEYSGDSMAVDSIGNILGMLSGREGILVCDLDDRAWSLRHKFSTRADRREDLYRTYFALDN